MTTRDAPDDTLRSILTRVQRIALIGASDKPDRPSNEVMHFLLTQGYDVVPINPRLAGTVIHGRTVLESLAALDRPVDMIDLFLNTAAVESMADELIANPAPVIWMQIGVVSDTVAEKATQAGKQVVMNRCPKREIPRLGLLR